MKINKICILIWMLVFYSLQVYSSEKADSLYKVLTIKTNGDYYVIQVQRNDSIFKIITKKVQPDKKANLKQLKKGEYYYFDFKDAKNEAKEAKVVPISRIANDLDVQNKYVFVDGDTKIKFIKRFHYHLYTTKNLIGLYYVPNPSKED